VPRITQWHIDAVHCGGMDEDGPDLADVDGEYDRADAIFATQAASRDWLINET
jgi:hypothetical protein